MPDGKLLIYGATGFTGRLMVDEALAFGLPCVLGGRSRPRLEALARGNGLPYRVAAVEDRTAVSAMVGEVAVVLNAAGPFRQTARPLADACLQHGAHDLDIAGEYDVIESLALLDERARQRGIMLLPSAGFDVVPSDCLAALVARRLPAARSLSIALRGLNAISRGSAESVFAQYADMVVVRRGGRLVRITPGELTRRFDFGNGPTQTTAVTWADVASGYYSTGIPDITVFYEATPIVQLGLNLSRFGGALLQTPLWKWWQGVGTRWLPDGPSSAERSRGSADVVVRVEDAQGRCAEARLHTPEVYSFTAATSVALAERALSGQYRAGFQTPSRAYGAEYVLSLPGVSYAEAPLRSSAAGAVSGTAGRTSR